VVFLTAAVASVALSKTARMGAVLGYLLAGVAIGPAALKLVSDPETVLTFSEIGVVMLLFVLGLELSPQRLWGMRRVLFGLGAAQLTLVTMLCTLIGKALGFSWMTSAIAGFGLAMSSTAFGIQILSERGELTDEHGRGFFGTSLFQDLVAIPLLALLPLLAVTEVAAQDRSPWATLGLVAGAIALVFVAGRFLLRPVFRLISKVDDVELFAAAALLVVLATALLMQSVGLSMGLGAFIAGVLLADSEYRHELESHIAPFKGMLLGLFFMAVGMSLDLSLLASKPGQVLGLLVGVMALQIAVMWGVARAFGYTQRNSVLLAALLATGGEFAFVIYATAQGAGLLGAELASLLNLVVALAMAVTPVIVLTLARIVDRSEAAPKRAFDNIPGERVDVVIAGFGRVGQVPGRVLAAQKMQFTIIEPSSEQVDLSRRFGTLLYFGDPARPEILRAARVGDAKVFVLAIDDAEHSTRVARAVRRLYPQLKIIARARNRQHAFKLMDLGIDTIIRETLYSSLLMTQKLLEELGLDERTAADRVERFRAFDEELLREQHLVYDDESALIQSNDQARRDLVALFEAADDGLR
jgi:glutathione-regulated potassium-efflux system protein KefB